MTADALLAPPVAFVFFLLVAVLVDAVGRELATKEEPTAGARAAYASGEAVPGRRIQPRYRLFNVGIGFTILHIAVLLLGTMPVDVDALPVEAAVLGFVAVSLFALIDSGIRP